MSKTKIILEYPYSEKWKYGYLNTTRDNRKTIYLYNSINNRSSVQYARYLLAVSHGRFLTSLEEADHIDDDKTNDNINNLQILSVRENNQKHNNTKRIKVLSKCPVCEINFPATKKRLGTKKINEKCCSLLCGNIKKSKQWASNSEEESSTHNGVVEIS